MTRLRLLARTAGLGFGLLAVLCPAQASAWDPSSTHQGLLEAGVVRSAVHLRWMDASELERGLFSAVRVDPGLLDPDWMRLLQLTMRSAHADVGARPLGGPGSCPAAGAPPETQQFCVDRELWEHDVLGWIRLGMIAEVTPAARHTHHFVDRDDPHAARWSDEEIPGAVLRRRSRTDGEPLSGVVTGTNFSGASDSAVAWLADPTDLLAPAQTYRHLALASLAPTQAERDHYFALALIGVGALVHVIQDLSVPAHARGDVSAFYAPLSPVAGDRGLPLQEFVRLEYGRRAIPGLTPIGAQAPSGEPLAQTLLALAVGDSQHRGLAELAARHFLSESSVPPPQFLADTLSPSEAATALLGSDHGLAETEVDGAILSPWPAQRGYLLSATGRALAAFDVDTQGRVRAYLDQACYRDQALQLLPAAVDTTRSIFDLVWPAWPEMTRDADGVTLEVPGWQQAELQVMVQTEQGERRTIGSHPLPPGSATHVVLGAGELAPGERIYLVLQATRASGPPIVLEHIVGAEVSPSPAPEPEPDPVTTDPDPTAPEDQPADADPDAPATPTNEQPADATDAPTTDAPTTDAPTTDAPTPTDAPAPDSD